MKLKIGEKLSVEQLQMFGAFAKICRHDILEMVTNAQSGHPGGSLSSIDFLTVLYLAIISQTGEKLVYSNGHISPAAYSILANLGYIDRAEVLKTFRKDGSIYEGHVTRHVPGIWYGTGPLGIGLSVAAAFALNEKMTKSGRKVFGSMGDGEADEGQVYEMMNFAAKNQLNNFIVFCDANGVQLSDSVEKIMPINIPGHFQAAGWRVIEVDGHDFEDIWRGLSEAYDGGEQLAGVVDARPVLIYARTVMGKGVDFMESEGLAYKATWHGKAPSKEQVAGSIEALKLDEKEEKILTEIQKAVTWKPDKPIFKKLLTENNLNSGKPKLYTSAELTDCRTAYGMTLLDLAEKNPEVIALDADLRASVMTKFLAEKFPERHIECGISEQHMMSLGGGFSLTEKVPFVSTFGAFMSSRAKDQARVNDVNKTNVKMVATHCGLSVGEDGPTHQTIDDMGSFLGMFNTMVIEPADPNQTDRIIRYIATHYGNFYVRMGRHKFPIITDEKGQPFYGVEYIYSYGRTDKLRSGSGATKGLTVVATGACVYEALEAWEVLAKAGKAFDLIAVSSIKQFDDGLMASIKQNGRVLTIEDHNLKSGLNSQVASFILENGLKVDYFSGLGVKEYEFSGKAEELYARSGIFRRNIVEYIDKL